LWFRGLAGETHIERDGTHFHFSIVFLLRRH